MKRLIWIPVVVLFAWLFILTRTDWFDVKKSLASTQSPIADVVEMPSCSEQQRGFSKLYQELFNCKLQQVRQACSLAQDKPGNSTDNLLIEYFEESCPPTFAAIAVHLQSREVVSWSWRLDRRGEQSCPCDFTENEVTAMQYALANCKLHLLACSGNRPVTLLTPLVFYPFLID